MSKRVLIALDGSEASERALEVGCRWAKALDCVADCLSVIDLSSLDVYDGFYMTDDQLTAVEEKFQKGVLEHAQEIGAKHGVGEVRTRLLKGHASKVLLEECEKDDVEMLVVGRTGKNFLDRLVLGSVSHRLSARASCPVVIVG
jgi:nucleotide-binding universal stress UspA family protein